MTRFQIAGVVSTLLIAGCGETAKTPPAIVAKVSQAVDEVLRRPDVRAHFSALNLDPMGGTPAAAAAFIRHETLVWGDVIKRAGIKPN